MAQFEAKEIGARIRQARDEKGLTQEEVAEMASFSKRSLQDYETGVTIPYRHLREIGRLLGKQTEWFLYGDPAANGGVEGDRFAAVERELGEVRQQLAGLGEMRDALARIEGRLPEPEAPPQAGSTKKK